MMTPTKEFDKDGNVLKVENLQFIQGVLGQGALGTVHLAAASEIQRRRRPISHSHEPKQA
jgi:hypothetical protein